VLPQLMDGDAPKQLIKAYFFEKGFIGKKKNKKSWKKYMAKSAEKWYPHESLIEFMINQIGEIIGVHMNQTKMLFINKQLRFLSKIFTSKNLRLVHGAEICGDYLNDEQMARAIANNKQDARDLFTIEFLDEAIHSIYPKEHNLILNGLIKMIAFDTIVGNNDRHFYNWGVLDSVNKNASFKPQLSPIYDSARGLMWNFNDEKIKHLLDIRKNQGSRRIEKYTMEAQPRISFEKDTSCNHFDLLEHILNKYQCKELIKPMASLEIENIVIQHIRDNFARFYISERQEIIELILTLRFNHVRTLCQ